MKVDTRNRILVASLLLFNEQGEPGTTTNEIADAVDISPGNLHYHFHKKRQLVEALLDEFQADAKRVLTQPADGNVSIDDFWLFLHLLLEFAAAYRFLFRDLESLVSTYPKAGRALKHFARGLAAIFELYLHQLVASDELQMVDDEARIVARNLTVLALFSERFDLLVGRPASADDSAVQVAGSILTALKPFAVSTARAEIDNLAASYEG